VEAVKVEVPQEVQVQGAREAQEAREVRDQAQGVRVPGRVVLVLPHPRPLHQAKEALPHPQAKARHPLLRAVLQDKVQAYSPAMVVDDTMAAALRVLIQQAHDHR